MAFEGHVANAMKGRGAEVPPRWYELPTFYFTNPHVVHDPDTDVVMSRSQQLDYELEFGVVVGRDLADAQPEECLDAVAGFTILNDFSARDLQFDEMAFESGTGQGQGLRPRHWARWS
jgi:2-keto-4-pentenoate hydratase/2-oxohepta-3-ene-1,7-dioic acid hydratase in catechol pathway